MIELPEILKPLKEKLLASSLEDIYSLIESYGIEVTEVVLPERKEGMYFEDKDNRVIFISKNISTARKRTAATHELIHAVLHTSGSILYCIDPLWRDKFEREAKIYTARILIPIDKLKKLLAMDYSIYEIAEELSVSEELVRIAIEDMTVWCSLREEMV